MTDSATDVFSRHAADYNALRRRLIPPFDAFYGTAIEALGLLAEPPRRVLDLGAGTGLLSRYVSGAFPQAAITLLDGSPEMLDQARGSLGDGATFVTGDLADPLPAGPWSAVVSALAIHHLTDEDKRALFARVHEELEPGGIFVNSEQVLAPTPALDRASVEWHHDRSLAAGASEEEWLAAVERMRVDRCATLEDQLEWLREAGFPDVDCLFKQYRFAVIVARKGG